MARDGFRADSVRSCLVGTLLIVLVATAACSSQEAVTLSRLPVVQIRAPVAASVVPLAETVTVLALVEDGDGPVRSVHFEIDGAFGSFLSVGPSTGPAGREYSGHFEPSRTGAYLLSVVARDAEGGEGRKEVRFEVVERSGPAVAVLTVDLSGDGSGRVTSTPAGIDCEASCDAQFPRGSEVELFAASAAGSRFGGWSEPSCGLAERCTLSLAASTSVRATFMREPAPHGIHSKPFAIVVVPDIQNMIGRRQGNNDMVAAMTDWIVAHAQPMNIRFVTQLGDVVDYGWDLLEWERADAQLGGLNGVLPYSVALGDHDYREEEDKGSSTRNYVEFFGPGRYSDYDWYGGANSSGTSQFQVFSDGEREFLHVALEWEPHGPAGDPTTPLGWAREVIAARPDMPTIISTHAYLWDEPGEEGRTFHPSHLEGFVEGSDGSKTYPGSTGQDIFEALVEPFPNVFMVLNGHYHRSEGTLDGEYHQVSLDAAGLEVYEMLSNYQSYPNGGDGWLRIIEFVPGGGADGADRISVRTYSPVLDAYQTDERSQFHFDLSFAERFPRD